MPRPANVRIDPFCASFLKLVDARIAEIILYGDYAGKFSIQGSVLHPSLAGAMVKFEKFRPTTYGRTGNTIEWVLYATLAYDRDDYLECNLFRSTRFPPTVAMGLKGREADQVFDFEPYRGRKIKSVVPGGTGQTFVLERLSQFEVHMGELAATIADDELMRLLPEAKPLKIHGGSKTVDHDLYISMPEVTRRIADIFLGQNKQMQGSQISFDNHKLRIHRAYSSGWLVKKL